MPLYRLDDAAIKQVRHVAALELMCARGQVRDNRRNRSKASRSNPAIISRAIANVTRNIPLAYALSSAEGLMMEHVKQSLLLIQAA